MLITDACRDLDMLNPCCRKEFKALASSLRQDFDREVLAVYFRPFETYRTPQRQVELKNQGGITNAPAWESAHQYGMAADFVPYLGTGWDWADGNPWEYLAQRAQEFGLVRPIAWDKCHIQCRHFALIHEYL